MSIIPSFPKVNCSIYGAYLGAFQLASLIGCGLDQVAPECFNVHANGDCAIPAPGIELDFLCPNVWPVGAVGAEYDQKFGVSGDSGPILWEASNLPDGLSMSADVGRIEGAPTQQGVFYDILVRATDTDRGIAIEKNCGWIEIGAPLAVNLAGTEKGCIEPGMDLTQYLSGGDNSPYSCELPKLDDPSPECPLGRGNGVMPEGMIFDEVSCQARGEIAEQYGGTWVWMIEVSQSGRTMYIPYCASQSLQQQHVIRVVIEGQERAPDAPLVVDVNSQQPWALDTTDSSFVEVSSECSDGSCNRRSISFRGSCSPLDVSLASSFVPTEAVHDPMGKVVGFRHPLKLSTGNQSLAELQFANRPWIATLRNHYCLSSAEGETYACQTPGKSESWVSWSILAKPVFAP